MRPDGKPEGVRQSMSWLHTWSGLLLGWLLYAVFFTGTLSYFRNEIDTWMRPELHTSMPEPHTAQTALDAMQRIAPEAASWTLSLPGPRRTVVDASWSAPTPAGATQQQRRASTKRATLDAATGERIEPRETRGGSFLYRFHFELYAMPRIWGRWIVGIATMFMLVAIISGVITHKKIFTDFFTFRPKKGQRSWLDAHNATAVLALPFHIVITFSGLVLLMNMLMPWGAQSVYGSTDAYFAEARSARQQNQQASTQKTGQRGERGDDPVSLAPIAPMLAQAMHHWPEHGVGSITVTAPNTARATVELREGGGQSFVNRGQSRTLLFDGVTGQMRDRPNASSTSWAQATNNVVTGVHLGRGVGPAMRWLLFLSGVVGAMMAASGMVLWVVKRLPERRKLGHTPFAHRLVEVLNVGSMAGLSVATAAYFWVNRLLPVGIEARSDKEIGCFFAVWLLCLLHPLKRTHRRAWLEQMALAALLFALLPLLNPMTGGTSLPVSIRNGQWLIAGFDLMMLALAALHATVVWWLLRSQPAARPAPRAAVVKKAPAVAAAIATSSTVAAATTATVEAVAATATAVAAGSTGVVVQSQVWERTQ